MESLDPSASRYPAIVHIHIHGSTIHNRTHRPHRTPRAITFLFQFHFVFHSAEWFRIEAGHRGLHGHSILPSSLFCIEALPFNSYFLFDFFHFLHVLHRLCVFLLLLLAIFIYFSHFYSSYILPVVVSRSAN